MRHSKMVKYVLLRPWRPDLDYPGMEVSSASSISNFLRELSKHHPDTKKGRFLPRMMYYT
jgi:hypothetical protein